MYKQVIKTPVEMYDYKKVLNDYGFHQKQINAVREELSLYSDVPKFILNEQVSFEVFQMFVLIDNLFL